MIDWATRRRNDPLWLANAFRRASTLVVHAGKTLVWDRSDIVPELVWNSAHNASWEEAYFLGTDDSDSEKAYFAIPVNELPIPTTGQRISELRALGSTLPPDQAALFTRAVALDNWHENHKYCAKCGNETKVVQAGHRRDCSACGTPHFPRTDPAIITLVHDGDDRCLLGRQASWPERRFSTLAGFVEPGESIEEAVIREVAEETGILILKSQYFASQAWPFPASLMLAFFSEAKYQKPVVDGEELTEAYWFTRKELTDGIRSGTLLMPFKASIAYSLITTWHGSLKPNQ